MNKVDFVFLFLCNMIWKKQQDLISENLIHETFLNGIKNHKNHRKHRVHRETFLKIPIKNRFSIRFLLRKYAL